MTTEFKIFEKIFEARGHYPRVGNYVLCNLTCDSVKICSIITPVTQKHKDFIRYNIGKIIKKENPNMFYDNPYMVKYENVPNYMKGILDDDTMYFSDYDFLFFSKNIQTVEEERDKLLLIKHSDKYNL